MNRTLKVTTIAACIFLAVAPATASLLQLAQHDQTSAPCSAQDRSEAAFDFPGTTPAGDCTLVNALWLSGGLYLSPNPTALLSEAASIGMLYIGATNILANIHECPS